MYIIIYIYLCLGLYMYICKYTYIYIYMYIYIYIYVYTCDSRLVSGFQICILWSSCRRQFAWLLSVLGDQRTWGVIEHQQSRGRVMNQTQLWTSIDPDRQGDRKHPYWLCVCIQRDNDMYRERETERQTERKGFMCMGLSIYDIHLYMYTYNMNLFLYTDRQGDRKQLY